METDKIEISEDVRESFPDDWPDWVLVSLTELEETEDPTAESLFLETLPEWAKSMLEEIIKPMLPSIQWKPDGQTGPEFLGKIIGHQEHLLESDEAASAMETQLIKLDESNKRFDTACKDNLSPEQYDQLIEQSEKDNQHLSTVGDSIEEVVDNKPNAFKRCIKRALEQQHNEKQEFFKAYSNAQSTPLYNEHGNIEHIRARTAIYTLMVINWPIIEDKNRIRNITDLHQFISRLLGNKKLEREIVRKICNEHGLKLASSGRPKKQGK